MTLYEIITKKKHNAELSTEEINRVVAGFSRGDIPDYQMSALLMAICFIGQGNCRPDHGYGSFGRYAQTRNRRL